MSMSRICTLGEEKNLSILFLSMSFTVLVILSQFWLFFKIEFRSLILQIDFIVTELKY